MHHWLKIWRRWLFW